MTEPKYTDEQKQRILKLHEICQRLEEIMERVKERNRNREKELQEQDDRT
jgi:hypothetical protein